MVRAKRGGQKKEIVRLKDDINLQITFSKRKQTVFKKASELGNLCGAEIGVIIFSPTQKVFSYGNPDIRSVIDSFKNHHHSLRLVEDGPNTTIKNLNNMLTQESAKLEMEKENEKFLDQMKNMREETEEWWNKLPNQLDVTQTNSLIKTLEDLKMDLRSQQSQPFQTTVLQSYNIVGGANIDTFDQRRMIDVNAMNCNPNMGIPNHGSMFGYNNNNNVSEGFPSI